MIPLRSCLCLFKANRGNSFQRFRDAVAETLRLYKIQIDTALLTGSLSCIWRCMNDAQKAHYRRPGVRVQPLRSRRGHDRIVQDRRWGPILHQLGQLIIDLHACECNADAPSLCFYGTCTINADALRNQLFNIHHLWRNHKYAHEESSSDVRTDGGSPTTPGSSLSYAEALVSWHTTESTEVNAPAQVDISEFYTLTQGLGHSDPPSTSDTPSYPLHVPAIKTAMDVVDGSSGFLGVTPIVDPALQAQSSCTYAYYAVPISSWQARVGTSAWDTRHNISGALAHQSFAGTYTNAPTRDVNGQTYRFYIVPESALVGRNVGQGGSNYPYQGANVYDTMY